MRFPSFDTSTPRPKAGLLAVAFLGVQMANGATFNTTVFTTGGAVNATAPDSVTYGNGYLWVEYGNGASSTDFSGKSTIVQYGLNGAAINTYSLAGSVDGLKFNPNTGTVWALQNQDANSQLSVINPATMSITSYTYGAIYNAVSTSRGIDDVAFTGGNVYLSVTNPASPSDPVVVQLTSGLTSPLIVAGVLNGMGLQLTDPDSLKSTPTGGLIQTGEGDGALTFINSPGTAGQTATSLKLVAAPGNTIGKPDDALFPTAASGTFYITDTSANTVYAVAATGLSTNTLFVNVGNAFGTVDQATGLFTPIVNGAGLHGIEFVPAGVPEPASIGLVLAGLAFGLIAAARKR